MYQKQYNNTQRNANSCAGSQTLRGLNSQPFCSTHRTLLRLNLVKTELVGTITMRPHSVASRASSAPWATSSTKCVFAHQWQPQSLDFVEQQFPVVTGRSHQRDRAHGQPALLCHIAHRMQSTKLMEIAHQVFAPVFAADDGA